MFDLTIIKEEVLFDEAIHQYTDPDSGLVANSYSQIASELHIGKYAGEERTEEGEKRLRWYANRGTVAHYGLENYLNGVTDLTVLKDLVKDKAEELGIDFKDALPFIQSGIAYIKEKNIECVETEKKFLVKRPDGMYAGTIDVVSHDFILDWKTSSDIDTDQYKLQIAAYAERLDFQKGTIVKLSSEGKAPDVIEVDVPSYREKWNKILDIYFNHDMDIEAKRTEVKAILKGSTQLPYEDAEEIIRLKKEEKNYDLMKKTVSNQIDTIKKKYTEGSRDNFFYSNGTSEILIEYRAKTTLKLNEDALKSRLTELLPNVDIEWLFDSFSTKEESGTHYLTIKEKKEPNDAPKKERKPRAKKEEKPEPVKQEEMVKESEIRPPEDRVTSLLRAKKFDDKDIEFFWIYMEGMFKLKRTEPSFPVQSAIDCAEDITLESIKSLQKDHREGKFKV